ncbi:hypothetical protein NSPZN2_40604 [Nitrospira defluvii]|uniref:Uncharacterized protein n=1 Tax=Nitrospira defluvii TaxID=330214 RepID=A0ABN7M134_9BACT|nr:hypothetical protein NSPZN2_40604 [Nitrospira defluvii]
MTHLDRCLSGFLTTPLSALRASC